MVKTTDELQPSKGAGEETPAQATEDRMLGGRLIVRQPAAGYRAGLDAALLAACVEAGAGEALIEAGCGVGSALLQAAARCREARFTGVERDASAMTMARDNIVLNAFDGRVQVVCADVEQPFKAAALAPFDAAFSNPPFFDDPSSLRGPRPDRRGAYIAQGGLSAWTRFLLDAVRPGGRVTVIHRAGRLADLLRLLEDGGGSFRIRPVQPYADQPAKRVLVRAVKAGRAPLMLLPPLVLHDRSGAKHTPQADVILRGEAALGWS